MISRYKIVLFDLDGTLCESGEGILNSAKHAIQAVGFPVPPPEIMRKLSVHPWDKVFKISVEWTRSWPKRR